MTRHARLRHFRRCFCDLLGAVAHFVHLCIAGLSHVTTHLLYAVAIMLDWLTYFTVANMLTGATLLAQAVVYCHGLARRGSSPTRSHCWAHHASSLFTAMDWRRT
jgi:hypothetical protein